MSPSSPSTTSKHQRSTLKRLLSSPWASKLVFFAFLAVFCLCWSQSRYATHSPYAFRAVAVSDGVHANGNILARSLEADDECRPLDFSGEAQCQNVQDECPASETVLSIPYLQIYFCAESSVRPVIFAGLIVWLFFLFSTLGISASDFFTPNLATLAQLLGLDENVAGVTFLAFGNGSPDLFSTFSAMRSDSGGLAIGELLGAASFIVTCVVGAMCIIKPFVVEPRPFIRDVGFFTLAVSMLLAFLWDGAIMAWEAASLVVVYVAYVLIVVFGSWWDRRKEHRRRIEALIRAEYADDDEEENVSLPAYHDESEPSLLASTSTLAVPTLNLAVPSHTSMPVSGRARAISNPAPPRLGVQTNLPPRSDSHSPSPAPGTSSHSQLRPHPISHTHSQSNFHPYPYSSHSHSPISIHGHPGHSSNPHITQMPSFSLVGALEFRQVVASLQHQSTGRSLEIFDSPITPFAGGHYHRHSRGASGSHSHLHGHGHGHGPGTGPEIDPWDAVLGNGSALPLYNRSPLRSPQPRFGALSDVRGEGVNHERTYEGDEREQEEQEDGTRAPIPIHIPSIERTAASTTSSLPTSSLAPPPPSTTRTRSMLRALSNTYLILFPSLHHFKSKTLAGRIVGVFAAPAVAALTLTLPVEVVPYESLSGEAEKVRNLVGNPLDAGAGERYTGGGGGETPLVEFEEEGVERTLLAEEVVLKDLHELAYNKWLTAAQCTFGPLFCVSVLFNGTRHLPWLLLATTISGLAVGLLVIIFSDRMTGTHLTLRMARCSMGFFVAIIWIMAIADEVVNVLQTFGFIFGLSDAIIGLTIFAVGNSLADLVANMSVAVFAPIMGFSACFGGPMLNLLLGVGLSGTYIIHTGGGLPYKMPFTSTLVVSSVGLLTILVATLVLVPLNGYYLTRNWGVFLIASYLGIMGVNLYVELRR